MESAAALQIHPSELVNTANAPVLAQPVPTLEKDTNPGPPQPTSEPSAPPIITKESPSTSDSAIDTVLNGSSPQQENLQSGDTDPCTPSHTPIASTLPPNYPPIVYPAVVSPGPTHLHELSENNDKMEIDGPPENRDCEDDHMEEGEEDASSDVSEGTNLKASQNFDYESTII